MGIRFQSERETYYDEAPPFPKNMLMEVTNACNQRCIFCGNQKMKRKKGFIDKQFAFDILRQAYAAGCREVGFYTTGEPLLYQYLEELVEQADLLGYSYIYLTTNGVLADRQRVKGLVERGLSSIKFSINAGNEDTYSQIHGKGDFERVITNLKAVNEYRLECGGRFLLYVSFIKTALNQNEEQMLRAVVKDFSNEFYAFDVCRIGGCNNDTINHIMVNRKRRMTIPCSMLFNRLHITYDGYLTACCVDFDNDLAVVDLRKQPLTAAWLCEKFVELRRWHLYQEIPKDCMCYNCVYDGFAGYKPLLPQISWQTID